MSKLVRLRGKDTVRQCTHWKSMMREEIFSDVVEILFPLRLQITQRQSSHPYSIYPVHSIQGPRLVILAKGIWLKKTKNP